MIFPLKISSPDEQRKGDPDPETGQRKCKVVERGAGIGQRLFAPFGARYYATSV